MEIIKVKNLSLAYNTDETIIKNLSMSFMKNKITAIVGPSGCGKSTFLTSLNAMLEEHGGQANGEILFKDKLLESYDKETIRKSIGLVYQNPSPFPLSIYRNMTYAPRYYGIKDKKILDSIVETNLKKVGLYDEVKDKLDDSALNLSGGQQQRLSIARALTVNPEVLLLDEPCSSLDVKNSHIIENLLIELAKEYTIIIVTHNLFQAKRLADYLAFILDGVLIEYSKTEEMFARPRDQRTKDYLEGIYG